MGNLSAWDSARKYFYAHFIHTEMKPGHWLIKFAPFRTSWSEIVAHGNFTLRVIRPSSLTMVFLAHWALLRQRMDLPSEGSTA